VHETCSRSRRERKVKVAKNSFFTHEKNYSIHMNRYLLGRAEADATKADAIRKRRRTEDASFGGAMVALKRL
jgi:hypothetical protein